ncbi:MAG TPA: multicopper oxidase domain-containing protein [Dehalococcoidia bacterium]|nr:multicopper oxidase domain-containing protein [Dehalococcoidia bacterium]
MQRKLILSTWALVAAAIVAVVAIGLRVDSNSAQADTELHGPPEAEVTAEGDWKVVHLTSSRFQWQVRDDEDPIEVMGYNEQIPGPTFRFKPGDKLRVYYRNDLDEPSTVHWHGLIVPNSMDGVGLLTQPAVMPGETFVYEFEIPNTPGTFMYHAHMNDHEQVAMGMSGAFIVEPRDKPDRSYDADYVVVLNDIRGNFLVNGKEFPNIDPWFVRKGDEIRVRLINISPDAIHPMHFHGHFTREIARDGTDIGNGDEAKVENTVLVAPGQTVDVSVKMDAPGRGAWLFHCHVLSHVAGPEGTSLNLALANAGMVIPVVYEDSLNFDQLVAELTKSIESLKELRRQRIAAGVTTDAVTGTTGHAAEGTH